MTNLVEIKNNQVVVSSRQIAENFGKEHSKVLRSIRTAIEFTQAKNGLSKLSQDNEVNDWFYETTYVDNSGKSNLEYLMNKNGFSLIVMGFTGEKAMQWKIQYIQAFEEMEKQLNQINKTKITEYQQKELECKKDEVLVAKTKLWLNLADRVNIAEYKQIAESYAFNTLAGKSVLPLPEVKEKTYSAGEIGKILGVSANKIGKLANAHNLKTEQYGKYFYDKSRYSNKEVETFRYYNSAINVFKELLA